jgi:hypothetical protein
MGEKTEKNIMYYMLISNNKQLEYRANELAWECDIMPRGNTSHPVDCSWGTSAHFLEKINTGRAPVSSLYYFKHTKVDKVRLSW